MLCSVCVVCSNMCDVPYVHATWSHSKSILLCTVYAYYLYSVTALINVIVKYAFVLYLNVFDSEETVYSLCVV